MLTVLKLNTRLFLGGTIIPDLAYATKGSATFAVLKWDWSKPVFFYGYIHK